MTTRELYSDCSAWRADGTYAEKDRGRAFYCTGYLRGAWEAMQEMAFCSGELVHIDRLLTAFKRVAEDNPQSMDKPAAWAVYAAFKIAYPCAARAAEPGPEGTARIFDVTGYCVASAGEPTSDCAY